MRTLTYFRSCFFFFAFSCAAQYGPFKSSFIETSLLVISSQTKAILPYYPCDKSFISFPYDPECFNSEKKKESKSNTTVKRWKVWKYFLYNLTLEFSVCHPSGSDLFLNSKVHDYVSVLLRIYTNSTKLAKLDFNSPIPGLTSFYDL